MGWNFRVTDEHTLDEILDLLVYLNEHPTASEILTLVHGVKVTSANKLRKGMQVNQENFEKEFWTPEVQEMGMPERADDGFRESLDFFKQKKEQLKIN